MKAELEKLWGYLLFAVGLPILGQIVMFFVSPTSKAIPFVGLLSFLPVALSLVVWLGTVFPDNNKELIPEISSSVSGFLVFCTCMIVYYAVYLIWDFIPETLLVDPVSKQPVIDTATNLPVQPNIWDYARHFLLPTRYFIFLFAGLFIGFWSQITRVEVGSEAVLTRFGRPLDVSLTAGRHFLFPGVFGAEIFNVKSSQEKLLFDDVLSKDGIKMKVTVSVTYQRTKQSLRVDDVKKQLHDRLAAELRGWAKDFGHREIIEYPNRTSALDGILARLNDKAGYVVDHLSLEDAQLPDMIQAARERIVSEDYDNLGEAKEFEQVQPRFEFFKDLFPEAKIHEVRDTVLGVQGKGEIVPAGKKIVDIRSNDEGGSALNQAIAASEIGAQPVVLTGGGTQSAVRNQGKKNRRNRRGLGGGNTHTTPQVPPTSNTTGGDV